MSPDPACPNMGSFEKMTQLIFKVNDAGHSLNSFPQSHEHIGVRTIGRDEPGSSSQP